MSLIVSPTNCTVTIDFKTKDLPIHLFASTLMRKFQAAKVKTPKATFLVYYSGKAVCVGSKTPDVAVKEVEMLLQVMIETLKADDKDKHGKVLMQLESSRGGKFEYQVSNVVASGSYNQAVNLLAVYEKILNTPVTFYRRLSYEPERFAGLSVAFGKGVGTIILFPSGKVNITGCKHIKDAESALLKFDSLLRLIPGTAEAPESTNRLCHIQPPVEVLELKCLKSQKKSPMNLML